MLTGIQRVVKENTPTGAPAVFSDLNNIVVCTVNDKAYSQYFGFNEEETKILLHEAGVPYNDEVKEMYDGYRIGNMEMYTEGGLGLTLGLLLITRIQTS